MLYFLNLIFCYFSYIIVLTLNLQSQLNNNNKKEFKRCENYFSEVSFLKKDRNEYKDAFIFKFDEKLNIKKKIKLENLKET